MNPIEVDGASVQFSDGTRALRGVSLTIAPGERVALVGASGSGKTTLARLLFGVVRCSQGQVRVFGRVPDTVPTAERARRAQLLFQQPRAMLHPAMTVRQLLQESARIHQSRRSVEEVLAEVGLSHRGDAVPSALSGGEQRRAGVARVLLAQPELLVADEPTTGLDASLKPGIAALLFAEGRTTVLVTHDIGLAADFTDRVVVLDRGVVVDDAPAPSQLTHPAAVALARASGVL